MVQHVEYRHRLAMEAFSIALPIVFPGSSICLSGPTYQVLRPEAAAEVD
jgi:hypothetical protein